MPATIVAQVPIEEYLSTVYKPDCDYVDGVLEERYLGEKEHSRIQGNLIFLLRSGFRGTQLKVWPEWRFQTRSVTFRVPDVIITQGEPAGNILRDAPLLCIEILSPEDRWSRVTTRIQEYLDFGVPEVWVVDPDDRQIWICKPGSIAQAPDPFFLAGTDIQIPFSDIFE